MLWVTRDHLHMDRIAAPWLINRFIDPQAEFLLVPFAGEMPPIPDDAVVFGIPGVGLGAHDEQGSAFRKVLNRYGPDDPALKLLADILESGIRFAQAKRTGAELPHLDQIEGAGLDALSVGMVYLVQDDMQNLVRSRMLYDALYCYCQATLILRQNPDIASVPPPAQWDLVRAELAKA